MATRTILLQMTEIHCLRLFTSFKAALMQTGASPPRIKITINNTNVYFYEAFFLKSNYARKSKEQQDTK